MNRLTIFAVFLALCACGQRGGDSAAAPSRAEQAAASPASPEERGRKLFNECAVCHSAKQGDANRVGPNLFGVAGREAASLDNFAYSKALAESGIVWTDENLEAYIESPQAFLRGNRMAYAGQRDPQKRADLIAYLKTLK